MDRNDPTDVALAALAPDAHLGARALRDAWALIRAGSLGGALDHVRTARRIGLPEELAPHAVAIAGIALARSADVRGASITLEDGWRGYPDFSALPALLGCAYALLDRHPDASKAFAGALAGDDPEDSLLLYRRELARLAGRIIR